MFSFPLHLHCPFCLFWGTQKRSVPRSLILQQVVALPPHLLPIKAAAQRQQPGFIVSKLSWHRSQGAQKNFSAGSAQRFWWAAKASLANSGRLPPRNGGYWCWCARAVLCSCGISNAALKQHVRNAVASGLEWSTGTLQQEQTGVVAVGATRLCPLPTKPGHSGLWTAPLRIWFPHSSPWHIWGNVPALENFHFNSFHVSSLVDLFHVSKCQVGLDGGTTDKDFLSRRWAKAKQKYPLKGTRAMFCFYICLKSWLTNEFLLYASLNIRFLKKLPFEVIDLPLLSLKQNWI